MTIQEIRENYWLLAGKHYAYTLALSDTGNLINPYWGQVLPSQNDYPKPAIFTAASSFDSEYEIMPEEFPLREKMKFTDPCLLVNFENGTRDTAFAFTNAQISQNRLVILLTDPAQHFEISLNYQIYEDEDTIKKWVVLKNNGTQTIHFDRIFSANITLPHPAEYSLTHLYGQWNHEFNKETSKIPYGKLVLESRRLTSSHQHSPAILLHPPETNEYYGRSYFCILGWSGNWKISVEKNSFGLTRAAVGINDFDFYWPLAPGAEFTTPPVYSGVAQHGFHEVSRRLHTLVRSHLVPHPTLDKKVLYNSWEATQFDVTITGQKKLAQIAAEIGVELFVLDDGWFSGRHSDQAGLGDWWPDQAKFPNGLKELSDWVQALGMDFGLWIEPEMVNPDSDLYRQHPNWILHYPDRQRTLARNQSILDLTNPQVQAYLHEYLTKVITETGVDFIKWDMNRNISEAGISANGNHSAKQVWVQYTHSVYRLWDQLRQRFPHIIFQTCSGGGGRSDYGMLTRADQVWISDNTDPTERLSIQEGFSLFYPASVMESWVTDSGAAVQDLDYRFLVSMMGVLGIGADISRWNEQQKQTARTWIERYKQLRPIIQHGTQYRLLSARDAGYAAVQYLDSLKQQGVIFYVRSTASQTASPPVIFPQGLDENAQYTLSDIDEQRSGVAWQQLGFRYALPRNYSGQMFTIRRI